MLFLQKSKFYNEILIEKMFPLYKVHYQIIIAIFNLFTVCLPSLKVLRIGLLGIVSFKIVVLFCIYYNQVKKKEREKKFFFNVGYK